MRLCKGSNHVGHHVLVDFDEKCFKFQDLDEETWQGYHYQNEGDCEIESARSSVNFPTDPSPEDKQGEIALINKPRNGRIKGSL